MIRSFIAGRRDGAAAATRALVAGALVSALALTGGISWGSAVAAPAPTAAANSAAPSPAVVPAQTLPLQPQHPLLGAAQDRQRLDGDPHDLGR